LETELRSPGRIRRSRALAIVRTLDMAHAVEGSLVLLLDDVDPEVRAAAAGLLAKEKGNDE
jgi:hypothetical protein